MRQKIEQEFKSESSNNMKRKMLFGSRAEQSRAEQRGRKREKEKERVGIEAKVKPRF